MIIRELAVLILALLSIAPNVYGATYYVDCDTTDGTRTHDTITAALAATTDDAENTINVKGTCAEAVTIAESGLDATHRLIIQTWDGNAIIEGTGLSNASGITINSGEDYITIQSSGVYTFTVQNFEREGVKGGSEGNAATSDYIKISGLILADNETDTDAFSGSGITLNWARYATIENNVISPLKFGVIRLFNSVNDVDNHTVISGNNLSGVAIANVKGIDIRKYGSYIDILNNTITTSWASDAVSNVTGILAQDSDGINSASTLNNIVMDGNTVVTINSPLLYSANGVGIQMQDCLTCEISDNIVGRWGEDGIEVDDVGTSGSTSCNVIVERNKVYDYHGKASGSTGGVEIADYVGDVTVGGGSGCLPVIVRNNIVYFSDSEVDTGGYGVRGFGTHSGSSSKTRVEYYNNTCYSNLAHTIPCYRFSGLYSLTMKNNIGRSLNARNVIDLDTIGTATVSYNSMINAGAGDAGDVYYINDGGYVGYNEAEVTNGDLFAASGLEPAANYLGTDPNFTSAPTDLSLTVGDDRIDTGTDLSSLFTDDYSGITRPQGSGYDIGSYEYVAPIFTIIGSGTTTIGSGTTTIQ